MKAAEIVREPLQDCPNGPVTAARRPPCRAAGRIVQLAAARQNARLPARHGVPSWASSSSQIIAAGDEEAGEARAPAYLKLSDAFSPTAQSPRPARPPAVRVRADGYFNHTRVKHKINSLYPENLLLDSCIRLGESFPENHNCPIRIRLLHSVITR